MPRGSRHEHVMAIDKAMREHHEKNCVGRHPDPSWERCPESICYGWQLALMQRVPYRNT